jgi:hypothetical protein
LVGRKRFSLDGLGSTRAIPTRSSGPC